MKEKDKKALHDQIVKEVKQDFEERRQKRRPVELAWRLNMNFLMGNQYASITPTGDIDDYGQNLCPESAHFPHFRGFPFGAEHATIIG